MCILFFQLNDVATEDGYRLILASNRDEYWVRPTGPAEWQQGGWLGGIDLKAEGDGGTWLGIEKSGKIGVLLNVLSRNHRGEKGKGHLVADYLTGVKAPEDYATLVKSDGHKYSPFHLYLLDISSDKFPIHYITNSEEEEITSRTLKPGKPSIWDKGNLWIYISADTHGAHSCGNNTYSSPWKKVIKGKDRFTEIVTRFGDVTQKCDLLNNLFSLLKDGQKHFPDEVLQKQFINARRTGGDIIKENSAVFVWSPSIRCGTRTHTVILIDHRGNCDYIERTMVTPVDVTDPQWTSVTHTFCIS